MNRWLPIASLPTIYKTTKRMFVVIGIDIPVGSVKSYTSDPYCVWVDGNTFARWPHDFAPTHFCELPRVASNESKFVIKRSVPDEAMVNIGMGDPEHRNTVFVIVDNDISKPWEIEIDGVMKVFNGVVTITDVNGNNDFLYSIPTDFLESFT